MKSIWFYFFLLIVVSSPPASGAPLSPEAKEFHRRLLLSDSVEEFQLLEGWVFEEGLGLKKRLARIEEAQAVISKLRYYSRHRLGLERISLRLKEEFPNEWKVWQKLGEIQLDLPIWGVHGENGIRRLAGWSSDARSLTNRDRIISLQYFLKAVPFAERSYQAGSTHGDELAKLYLNLADAFMSLRGDGNQTLTDLTILPEPDNQRYRSSPPESLVTEDGRLKLPKLRNSFEEAETDYERSYWFYHQARLVAKELTPEVIYETAFFWHRLLGVENLAFHGYIYIEGTESEYDMSAPGEFELHTLKDHETIVLGPHGPERITLPDHCRYLTMLRDLVEDPKTPEELRWRAAEDLIEYLYPDRRQFDKALEFSRKLGTRKTEKDGKENEEQVYPDDLETKADLDRGGSFAVGSPVFVSLYSRGLDEVELELWKLNLNRPWETLHVGRLESLTERSLSHWLGNKDWDDRDIRKEHEWFEENFDQIKKWKAAIRKKPNRMQTTTKVRVPLDEPGNYVVVRRTSEGFEILPINLYDVAVIGGGLIEQDEVDKNPEFYAVDPISGKALEGVELSEFHDGIVSVSDQSGKIPDLPKRGPALVRRPGSQWQLIHWDSGDTSKELWESDQIQPFIISNQPLYRPGQTVSLTGWLRFAPEWKGRERFLPDELPVRLIVSDPTGRQIWKGDTRLDEFGGFSAEFKLGDEVVLGKYSVEIREGREPLDSFSTDENGPFDWKSIDSDYRWIFEVGEFRKPDFQVSLNPVVGDDGFAAVVEARYLSGEPVKNATVAAKIRGYPYLARFYPKRKWDDLYWSGYQWGLPIPTQVPDWEKWAMWSEYHWDLNDILDELDRDQEVVAQAQGRTDGNGRARLKFDAEFPFLDRFSYDINVKAAVTEFTGRSVGAEKSLQYTARPFEAFVRPLKGFYRTGEQVDVEVGILNTKQEPHPGTGIFKFERVMGKKFQPVFERKVQINGTGEKMISFPAPAPGQYRCLFVGGGGERGFVLEVVDEENPPGKFGGVQLIPREFIAQPNDSVYVLIKTDEPSTTVWVFELLPNGLRRSPRTVTTKDHTALLRIPIIKASHPNIVLEGMSFQKGRARTNRCMILVPDEESRLNVQLKLDQESGTPGEKAAVEVAVRSHEDRPKESSVALTVFDRALEDLSGPLPSTSRLREFFTPSKSTTTSLDHRSWSEGMFRGLREPGVFSERSLLGGRVPREKSSRFVKFGEDLFQNYSPPELPNQVGGGFGNFGNSGFPVTPATPASYLPQAADHGDFNAEEKDLLDGATIRRNFTDRAYWGAGLRTDKDGRLKVEFDLPGNLTSWRVQSWAFGRDRSFGESKLELPVSKPLQLRPLLPRAAVVGDELKIGAMLQNRSDQDDEFLITIHTQGASVIDPTEQHIRIKAGEEGTAHWRVKMEQAGGVTFLVKATSKSGKLNDGFEYRVPTVNRESNETVSDKTIINREETNANLRLPFEPSMRGRELSLRIAAHPGVSALKVLPDLVAYPYGCVEQTLNRFLPLLVARDASKQLGLDWKKMTRITTTRDSSIGWISGRGALEITQQDLDLTEEEVNAMVHLGTQRLKEMQKDDGSWGWFSKNDPRDRAYLTALAVRGLIRAHGPGEPSKEISSIRRGINYLEGWSRKINLDQSNERALAEASFIAWVLQEAESDQARKLVGALWKIRDELPLTSRIHLALAQRDKALRDAYTKEITQLIGVQKNAATQAGSWWDEPVERRACFLKLLIKTDASDKDLHREILHLLSQRADGIRWKNTRESALCIEAILEAATAIGFNPFKRQFPFEPTINVMNKNYRLSLSQDNLWMDSLKVKIDDHWQGKEIPINVTGDGKETLFVDCSITYPSSRPETLLAETQGIEIKRKFYLLTPDGDRQLIPEGAHLTTGETIEVELLLESDQPREFIHLRDAIPAGFEPLNQSSGFHRGAFQEMRTGEAHFFITNLTNWNRRQRYRVNVVTEGSSLALPAHAECMYSPEVYGRTATRTITVRR